MRTSRSVWMSCGLGTPAPSLSLVFRPRAGGIQRLRHPRTMRRVCLVVLAVFVLAGCGSGGMSETDQFATESKLSSISSQIWVAKIKGSEFEMEQETQKYVTTLRVAVDEGYDKQTARRLLTDLASGNAADCSACVAMLDRERENLA